MANAWNELTWGIGNYGEQNNHTEVVGSVSASSSVGDFQIETEQRIEVSSLSLSANIGSATSDVLNNGWGARVWGFSVWGSVGDVVLTGQQLTAATGQLTASISIDVDVDGISAQTNIGESASRVDANPTAEGIALQTFVGNEDTEGEGTVIPTGASASANPGQATIDPTFLVGEGWGRDTFGNLGWGVNYSVIAAGPNGLSASIVTGNEDAFTDIIVEVESAGQLQTAITPVGTKADSDTEIAVGELISTGIGDVTVTGIGNIGVTGVAGTGTLGDETIAANAAVGVTGVEGTGTLGDETIAAAASVDVTGVEATGELGTATSAVFMTVTPTGIAATGSIGDVHVGVFVTFSVTGVSATTALGDETVAAKAVIVPTGVEANFTLADVLVYSNIGPQQTPSYAEVGPLQTPNWVDEAA